MYNVSPAISFATMNAQVMHPTLLRFEYMYIYRHVYIDERGGHDDDHDGNVATTAMATLVMRARMVFVRSLLTLVVDNV